MIMIRVFSFTDSTVVSVLDTATGKDNKDVENGGAGSAGRDNSDLCNSACSPFIGAPTFNKNCDDDNAFKSF